MKKTNYVAKAAMISALYVSLTYMANALGLASGVVQIRFSEALCILPLYTPAAIPGLFAGCIIANLLTGCALWDVVFGSVATLIGALFCVPLGRKCKWFASLPTIISNTLIIPAILTNVYNFSGGVFYFTVTVFIGELISCGIFGTALIVFFSKRNIKKL